MPKNEHGVGKCTEKESHRMSTSGTLKRFDTVVRRMPWFALAIAAVAVVVIGFVRQTQVAIADSGSVGGVQAAQGGVVAREGTRLVGASGSFSRAGDRLIFHAAETGRSFIGLENLSLERVARQSRDDLAGQLWSVTGTVTEFQGSNYVLVSRVVLKDRGGSAANSR